MIQLIGVLIVLLMLGYILQIAAGMLKVPAPVIMLLQLLIALVFVIYVLGFLGALPPSWRLLPY